MKQVPNFLKKIAANNGYNSIEFIGILEDKEVYGMGVVDKDGFPVPTGLPNLLLWDGKEQTIIHGYESFDILDHFE